MKKEVSIIHQCVVYDYEVVYFELFQSIFMRTNLQLANFAFKSLRSFYNVDD